jgi:hypothetical protein
MKITTTLTIMCLILFSCQESGTYSESYVQLKNDTIQMQKEMFDILQHNCNSFISELQGRNVIQSDAYEYTVKGARDTDSLSITVNKDYLNATILIRDGQKEIRITYGSRGLLIDNPYE